MYLPLQDMHLIPSLLHYLMLYLVIFHLVQLALLLLFSYFILLLGFYQLLFGHIVFNCSCAILFFSSSLFSQLLLLPLFSHIIFFLYLSLLAFSLFHFLLFLNCFFFLALSCCTCASSSFVTVPVSALATEEYPTVKSAIAQIGNSFFSFSLSPYILFTSTRIGCITRISKRYKYKMQMKYISFKDFIVEKKKHRNMYDVFSGVCLNYLHVTFA